jgi:FMN phosphatase YigB (HAD superfamily)
VLGIPQLTFMAAIGATVERGWDYRHVFDIVGAPDWRRHLDAVERRYGGFRPDDLYPDALPAVDGLRRRGFRVAIVANQPASRTGELRALGFDVEFIAMSEELGVATPAAAFFEQTLALLGGPDPRDVVYVGDRIDNDVVPAAEARMRAVWLRRGPWGVIPTEAPSQAAMVITSLAELVDRIDECWSAEASVPSSGLSPS